MFDCLYSQIIGFIDAFFTDHAWLIHLIHLVFGILLFFLINWIGRNSISEGYMQLSVTYQDDDAPAFNFVFKVVGPVVYLVLCAVLFQSLGLVALVHNCYFIVVYYWAFRLLWNIVFNRWILTDWIQLAIYWISSIGLAFWVYSNIEKVEKILPDGKGLIDQMWILIIAFLYAMFNKMRFGYYRTIRRKDKYIESRYGKFKKKYNSIINPYFDQPFYEALVYAIMIYEDFNRPYVVRMIEYVRFFLTKRSHTLGIMQVTTTQYISDEASVRLAIDKIVNDINAYIEENPIEDNDELTRNIYANNIADYVAKQYNGGNPNYSGEIMNILNILMASYYENRYPETFTVLPTQNGH